MTSFVIDFYNYKEKESLKKEDEDEIRN